MSRQGLEVLETPRDISFCGHVILQNDLFEIPNALEDSRFADNPLVTGSPFIRFYAGMPIQTFEGLNIGTSCLIDDQPKNLTTEEKELFAEFTKIVQAYCVNNYLNLTYQIITKSIQAGIIVYDRTGNVIFTNPSAKEMLGKSLPTFFSQDNWKSMKQVDETSNLAFNDHRQILYDLHHQSLPHAGQALLMQDNGQEMAYEYRIEPLIRGGILTNTVIVLKQNS
jgi:PAS domain-containing protein